MDRSEVSLQQSKKKLKRIKICGWVSGICGIIMLVVGIAMPFVLMNYINSQARDQVVMKADNEDTWAQVPGKSGLVIQRQFTFYNFTNPEDFFVRNALPILQESKPVIYQELQNFTNPQFSQNQSLVNYDFLETFIPMSGSTGEEIQSTVNLGPLGFWYQVKSASFAQIGIQAFYGLLSGLVEEIPFQIGSGLLTANHGTIDKFESLVGVNDFGTQTFVFNDPNYGWSANAAIWAEAYEEHANAQLKNKPTCQLLMNYFKINSQQLTNFFDGNTKVFTNSIGVFNTYTGVYCKNEQVLSNAYCMALIKWSQNQPNSKDEAKNTTTLGTPFIKTYYDSTFLPQHTEPIYSGITFPYLWAKIVMEFTEDAQNKDQYTTSTSTLINMGNLNYLYEQGSLYDLTNDETCLTNIANRFQINSTYFKNLKNGQTLETIAFVFWSYSKYMVYEFAQRSSFPSGGPGAAALGSIAGQAMYSLFDGTMKLLPPTIIATYMAGILQQYGVKLLDPLACKDVFYPKLNNDQIPEDICTSDQFKVITPQTLLFMYDCNIYGSYLESCAAFDAKYPIDGPLSAIGLITQSAFMTGVINNIDGNLAQQYGCYSTVQKCSYFELVAMQWNTLAITKNPPTALKAAFTPANSVKEWFPLYLPHAFEWGYYVEKFQDTFTQPATVLTIEQATYLLSFERLFSGSQITQMFTNLQNFEQMYYFASSDQLLNYTRFVIVFGAFELTQTRTANEFLSGYEDKFLKNLAFMNPEEGGDPSINWVLQFNDPNMTLQTTQPQQMNTGYSDVNQVRQYTLVDNLPYTTYNATFFDGFSPATWKYVTPWEVDVNIVGTDSGENQPNLGTNTELTIYLTSVSRGGTLAPVGNSYDVYGLNTLRYEMEGCMMRNITICPQNTIFYSNVYDYAINLTSIQQGPIFNTKTHMLDIEPPMYDRITVLNVDGNVQMPNQWDDTYMGIEPITGTAIQTVLNLQGGLLFEPDLLFNQLTQPVMIPFFYVYRSGNFTSDQIDNLLGSLKTGLTLKKVLLWVGTILGGLLVIGCGACFYFYKKLAKQLSNQVSTHSDNEAHGGRYNALKD